MEYMTCNGLYQFTFELYNEWNILFVVESNNAGVMAPPFMLTQDNLELQFGTNHIGKNHKSLDFLIAAGAVNLFIQMLEISLQESCQKKKKRFARMVSFLYFFYNN